MNTLMNSFILVGATNYEMGDTYGMCEDAGLWRISTQAECEAAAEAIGVPFGGASHWCESSGSLPGCYTSGGNTYFNLDIDCGAHGQYGLPVCEAGVWLDMNERLKNNDAVIVVILLATHAAHCQRLTH